MMMSRDAPRLALWLLGLLALGAWGGATAQEKARLQHDLMRCMKFFDVNACDDALRSKPDDPEILVAKGDALSHGGHPADAILIYLHAGGLLPPGDEGIKLKLSAAEAQREGLAAQCQASADAAAADACQAALLRGSTDEFTLLERRATLLQSLDKPAQGGSANAQTTVGARPGGQPPVAARSRPAAARVASTNAVTYSNDASPAQTN